MKQRLTQMRQWVFQVAPYVSQALRSVFDVLHANGLPFVLSRRLSGFGVFAGWMLLGTAVGYADQAAEEASIRKLAEAYVQSFNAHDAKGLAGHWSPQAVYVNPGNQEQVSGREAIEQQFAQIFMESPQVKLEVAIESIQFVSPSVAIEQGTSRLIRPEGEPEVSEYSAVHVLQNGKWLIDRVTESDPPSDVSSYEHLKELAWMIGSWIDEDDKARVDTTCQWTKNQAFMTRSFIVTVDDRIDMSGMQIIGWDENAGTIRSWAFDSDGGFSEATWKSKEKGRWIITASATLADGRKASAINIMTKLDENSFTWESKGRELDGEILPAIEPVTLVRDRQANRD